ncbi:hypothetical protein [Tenggerimyces flavus]|uniref:PASTA domain-containing protein n=1 Tax=Tenggerimyces flavus TaxID=1708749 RepID=A0ABV7YRE7_9ACTN|nr:hypothetical protein [Tenggerimyces flavus]MBM7786389.1 beta-lactam-binding protein with PASTA domain [Tenggerimyces flavus]
MTVRTRVAWVVVLAFAAACGPTAEPAAPGTSKPPAPTTSSSRAELPDLVGKGLQFAQDTAQAAGFVTLTSHDASGRERLQVSDRNWKVCFQSPPPGSADPKATVDFGVVRLEETCPAKDAPPSSRAPSAPAAMPSLVGKSLRVAEEALGANASATVRDASGKDRAVLVSTNWQVCAQDPAPGAAYDGVPVTLDVVKYGENCPSPALAPTFRPAVGSTGPAMGPMIM